jgi:hypothetical protein
VVFDIPRDDAQRPFDVGRSQWSDTTRFQADRPGRLNSETPEGEVEDAFEVAQCVAQTQCAAVVSF